MKVSIVAFGIAKDIMKGTQQTIELPDAATVGVLKKELCRQFPELERLRSFAIAVNEEYQNDDFVIGESDEVVIIPPVSGG